MKRLIARLTIKQIEAMLATKERLAKAEPLKRKLAKLQKAAEKIQQKIDRLLGGKPAGRRGRPPKARRGRPPTKGKVGRPPKSGRKPGRPAKRGRKMSAAAQKRVALAVSRAQKRRWAAFRKAQKAKTKAAASRTVKTVRRVPKAVAAKRASKGVAPEPRPGTLSSQIQKVAGEEAGQV